MTLSPDFPRPARKELNQLVRELQPKLQAPEEIHAQDDSWEKCWDELEFLLEFPGDFNGFSMSDF